MTDYDSTADASEILGGIAQKADAPEFLDALNAEQRAAVMHEGSPLLILAGAGSGKTRVITTKIAYLIRCKAVRPESILAVTFTKKAANEMHERAVRLEPDASRAQIRTFHSFGAWFLRVYHEEAGVDANFTVYDDDDVTTLLTKAVPSLTRQNASVMAHKISRAKDYCYLPDDPRLCEIDDNPKFAEIYAAYQERLRQTGNVDFGDLIMLPVLTMQGNENIRLHMHFRFRVIMVDEYQDSNVAQYQLLQALSGVSEGSGTYVCVVGDDDQSIYKFRGAEIDNILTFEEKFPGTQTVRLEQNYRSRPQILHQANEVIANNGGRLGKTLRAVREEGVARPTLVFLPNQEDECAFVAELVRKAHQRGCHYADWAILYRTNAQSLGFESKFLHESIPYTIVGALKFYEREEIKDILAYLALIANPKDEIAFRRVVNKPARGIGASSQDKLVEIARAESLPLPDVCRTAAARKFPKRAAESLAAFATLLDKMRAYVNRSDTQGDIVPAQKMAEDAALNFGAPPESLQNPPVKLAAFVEYIVEKSGFKDYHAAQDEITGTQRVANMQELANNAVLYPCTMEGLLDFLDHIELDRTLESPDDVSADRVTLITLHNTKGLEFPRVVITGMERGVFPRADKNRQELEEERRLMYVGITRAKDELYLTSCAVRRMYGKTAYTEPSVFLQELDTSALQIIGNVPYSFSRPRHNGTGPADYGSADGLERKWQIGTRVYHDDYGYGIVAGTARDADSGEFTITVRFENGGQKRFLPKYQENRLMVIKD